MPLAGAIIGVGGSLLSSSAAKSAANTAADAQVRVAEMGIAEQRRQYDQTRGDMMPWQDAGKSALGLQGNLLGLNGADAQSLAIAEQRRSPLYEALFRNGNNTMLANASATGGLRGGNQQRASMDFGSDTLARVIESQLAKLGGVSEQGQNAAGQLGAMGQNSANSISQLLAGQGQAQAGAALAGGAASAASIKDITASLTGLVSSKDFGKLF